MVDIAGHYKILIYFYQATQNHNPQYSSLYSHCYWQPHTLCCKLVVAHTLIMIIRIRPTKLVDSCDIINFCNSTINQFGQSVHFNTHCRWHNNLRFQWHLAHLLYLIIITNKYKRIIFYCQLTSDTQNFKFQIWNIWPHMCSMDTEWPSS